MITIIHGDDVASSRKYFLERKLKTQNPITLDGQKVTITDITQVLEGDSLFFQEKYIFIEDFFSKRKSDLTEIIALIEKNKDLAHVYFWEGKEIPKKTLHTLKFAESKIFLFPKILFQFLESLRPQNSSLISTYHKVLQTTEPELVFVMLIRQFRLLLFLSYPNQSENEIDEIKRLAPWQVSKLKKQTGYFSLEKLPGIYKKLFELEKAQKTGTLPCSLSQAIDFFLLEL